MRIVAASDLHGVLPHPDAVPEGDVLVLAGDICPGALAGRQAEWLSSVFADWIADVRVSHVVATWGNHDWVGQRGRAPDVPGVRLLVDDGCVIDGVRFWCSPWSLTYLHWAFMAGEAELAAKYCRIPAGTDVVVSHGPPLGYGDMTVDGFRVGCVSLRERLRELGPRLAVFGHIHEAAGQWDVDGGTWVNASLLDHRYRAVRGPVSIDIAGRP